MKHIFITSLTQLVAKRRLLALVIGLLLVMIAAITYFAVTIQSSDVRIITHYTAYGSTHFFRDSWTYLLSFIGFVVIMAGFSIAISLKMLRHGRESLAILMNWLGIAIILIAVATYRHIIELV